MLVSGVASGTRVNAEGMDMVGMSLACQQAVDLSLAVDAQLVAELGRRQADDGPV